MYKVSSLLLAVRCLYILCSQRCNQGDLFSFYELCRNYQWTVEDEKVLSFYPSDRLSMDKRLTTSEKVQFASYLSEKELGFINILHGRSAGKTKVTISFSCEFKSSGFTSETKFYDASISLSMVPDLSLALGAPTTWLLPPHYTTKSLLPSSSGSYGHSRKGTITYSLLRSCYEKNEMVQKDSISVEGDRIRTTESNNIACIQEKDHTTGRTEVAACIKVVEVAQIRTRNEELPFHAISLAVGAELSRPITYRDVLGNPFYEAHDAVSFDVKINYPDVVSINSTRDGSGYIILKAIRHGRALLRVSIDSILQKSNYLLILVGAYIHPQTPVLPKGSRANFIIEGLNDHVSGHRVTANSSVVSVDISSGIAEAVGEGTTQVYLEASSLKLATIVTVLTKDIVSVDAPKEMLTNVPFPTQGYSFLVKFSNTYDNKFRALGKTNGVAYDCRVCKAMVRY